MNDAFAVIFACTLSLIVGVVLGFAVCKDIVNGDCVKYSQYVTDKYKLTCEKK